MKLGLIYKYILGTFIEDCTENELDGMLKMMGVFVEMERNIISERVKRGADNVEQKVR